MRKSTASKRENRGKKSKNPHPLFGMKTELVWEVKYDEYGAHRPMDIAGSAMPFMEMEFLRRTLLQSWR